MRLFALLALLSTGCATFDWDAYEAEQLEQWKEDNRDETEYPKTVIC